METPREYHYTYYSYEEWGMGYFGSRSCECLPEEDIKYFGSFSDKTFKPTQKIILKSDYSTREEALLDEIILQQHYKVVENPHFANRAYQTSTKFYVLREQAKKNGEKSMKKQKELGIGICSLSAEQIKERNKKITKKNKENGVSFFGFSEEKLRENAKKGGTRTKELGVGCFSISKEERTKLSKNAAKITNSQKWMCLETGYISTAAGIGLYQKARGIDTSKRKRLS